jgi:hypothetical protein
MFWTPWMSCMSRSRSSASEGSSRTRPLLHQCTAPARPHDSPSWQSLKCRICITLNHELGTRRACLHRARVVQVTVVSPAVCERRLVGNKHL